MNRTHFLPAILCLCQVFMLSDDALLDEQLVTLLGSLP
jgi:hypothetical protein